jgi:hypothetical protein
MLKVILLSALIIFIATVALSIRIIIKPKGEFLHDSCSSVAKKLGDDDFQCACGRTEPCEDHQSVHHL